MIRHSSHVMTGAVLFFCCALPGVSLAHGGQYNGPALPPSPPNMGPVPPARPGNGAGAFGGRTGGRLNPRATQGQLDVRRWETWWGLNKEDFLPVRGIGAPGTAPSYDRERRGPTRDEVREKIIPALLKSSASKDFEIRNSAALALGKVGDLRELPVLEKLLADSHRTVVEAAILGLGLLQSQDAEGVLIKMVEDRSRQSRQRGYALVALGLSGGTAAQAFLTKGLGKPLDTSSQAGDLDGIRALAVGLSDRIDLAKGGDAGPAAHSTGHLLAAIRSHTVTDRTFLPLAYQGLAKVHDDSGITTILSGLAHKKSEVRGAAANAAGRTLRDPDKKTARVLVQAVDDEGDPLAQRLMIASLGRIGGPYMLKALTRYYGDRDRNVQAFAILGLGMHKDANIVARFQAAIVSEGDQRLKGAYAIALGLKRDATSVPVLIREIHANKNPEYREHLMLALALIGDVSAAPEIAAVLSKSNTAGLQAAAALSLGLLGHFESKDLLVDVLRNNGTVAVKGAAATGLGRMGDHRLIDPLIDFVSDEKEHDLARAFGVIALGILGEKEAAVPPFQRIAIDSNYGLEVEILDEIRDLL